MTNRNSDNRESGILYLVGTPLGNMSDFSPRALEILGQADLVACEDTRVTGLLLSHAGIHQRLISYHEHNKAKRGPELVARIREGQTVALVSDAGMPAISDPGQDLVALAVENGIPVSVIPGPTAALTALAASGLDSRWFVFEGFLPPKGPARRKRLELVGKEGRTVILYEAPHRLLRTLDDLRNLGLGRRKICAGRELTKRYEEYIRLTVEDMAEKFRETEPRGEFTLILEGQDEFDAGRKLAGEPPAADFFDRDEAASRVQAELQDGKSSKAIIKLLAEEYHLPKNEAYQLFLAVKEEFPGL